MNGRRYLDILCSQLAFHFLMLVEGQRSRFLGRGEVYPVGRKMASWRDGTLFLFIHLFIKFTVPLVAKRLWAANNNIKHCKKNDKNIQTFNIKNHNNIKQKLDKGPMHIWVRGRIFS